jgi:propionyl-CoA synthetase
VGAYEEEYRRSLDDPEGFWLEAAGAIDWQTAPSRGLDDSAAPIYRWFPDGVMNTSHNALDRHADGGRGAQLALVHDSPVTGEVRSFTYADLRDRVARVAGAMRRLGVGQGDRVVIYMPMIPEAVQAMLACARLGAVHSVVFGGFAPRELAARIDAAQPVLIVTASCGIEVQRVVEYMPLLNDALELAASPPERCIVVQRPQCPAELTPGRDVEWNEALEGAEPADPVPVRATDPLYILYTSGTTATPKGVVRDNGGHAVALQWSMENVYDVGAGEVMFTASDIGWVVGHSYIVYGPLITGCTTVMYEGKPVGTPDAGAFWRVIADHGAKALFTAPTAFRAIKKEDPAGEHLAGHDLSGFRCLFLAGERLDPDTYHWASDLLGVPVIDHWWQTETGWPVAANPMGLEALPVKPGSPTKPVPGWDVRILDEAGDPAPPGADGAVVMRLPLPPGALPTLWNDDERYVRGYLSAFEGCYLTGDGGHLDEDGYLYVMGRTDDVLNVAGHRLSTGSLEAALAEHADVAECAVIGVSDELKGQVPVGLVVLKAGADRNPAELEAELVRDVRREVGPVASLKRVVVVARLPKTRSGKILRRTMRDIADGREYTVPSTIDDPVILEELEGVLAPGALPRA